MLACPDCKQDLRASLHGKLHCRACSFETSISTPINLLPIQPRDISFSFRKFSISDPDEYLSRLDLTQPENKYSGPSPADDPAPSMLLSQVLAAHPAAKAVLDLGCGNRNKRPCFEFLGCQYVGLDLPGSAPDIVGDAHFLPFLGQQFDVVFSYAVLEHVYNPYVTLAEIRRVLKPDGIFIGSVSQGEPSHKSYFHHTAWALLALCEATGFRVTRLWSSGDTLKKLAAMGRYPKIIRYALASINMLHERMPIMAPRRMMRWSDQEKRLNQLHQAGAICFCMRPTDA